jgi:hypothetical protein
MIEWKGLLKEDEGTIGTRATKRMANIRTRNIEF